MKKLAFIGGNLIDGTGKDMIKNSLVLVEDKKIVYAGEIKEFGAEYERVDISGKTIMPGLIDTHLHFSGNLTDNDSDWVLENVVQKTVVAVQQAHECLENGLTTVGEISRSGIAIRDMVEDLDFAELVDTEIVTSYLIAITMIHILGLIELMALGS